MDTDLKNEKWIGDGLNGYETLDIIIGKMTKQNATIITKDQLRILRDQYIE